MTNNRTLKWTLKKEAQRERERLERELREAREREERQRAERERLEKERAELERLERDRALERERAERERQERERAERERFERERAERERQERERAERERAEREQLERELAAERERQERERAAAAERADREREERERLAAQNVVAPTAVTSALSALTTIVNLGNRADANVQQQPSQQPNDKFEIPISSVTKSDAVYSRYPVQEIIDDTTTKIQEIYEVHQYKREEITRYSPTQATAQVFKIKKELNQNIIVILPFWPYSMTFLSTQNQDIFKFFIIL